MSTKSGAAAVAADPAPKPQPIKTQVNEAASAAPAPAPAALTNTAIIADVVRLQKELSDKRNAAVEALLAQRDEIDGVLMSLGHDVHAITTSTRTRRRSSKPVSERFCAICEITGHDKRAHRSQTKKRKFTAEELAAAGLA